VLTGVVSELEPALAGQSLEAVQALAGGDLMLEFAGGMRRVRLRLGAGPGRSRLYALHGHPPLAEGSAPFADRLREQAAGARLESLSKQADERVVFFNLRGERGGRTLAAELLGRSANLILLDGERRILAAARALRSQYRRQEAGEPYQPPVTADRPGVLTAVASQLEPPGGPPAANALELERALAHAVRGLGSVLAREVAYRVASQRESLALVWAELVGRLRAGLWDPHLYMPQPLEELEEDTPLGARECFVAPWPLACAGALAAHAYPTFSEAIEIRERLWERWVRLDTARRALAASLEDERRRLRRLLAALEDDARRAAQADTFRRWGELLLREMQALRMEGKEVVVVDRYGGGNAERIPFDPALSPQQNAEALFGRYRRARRSGPEVERRRREAEGRLSGLAGRVEEALAARTLAEAEEMAQRWQVRARGAAETRSLEAPEGERGPAAQAREYRSSDGWTILVGRGARANDRLTFGIASPHDFWLHAAGRAGAHVVVRNPRRAAEMPARTMEEAAALAAWFSKGRGDSAVEVHYTQRRHVRRPRGAAPGQALLKRFRSIRVRPLPPARTLPPTRPAPPLPRDRS
jgi:predicted ribosome quality control (RQC) complex YloA/Tae2 family protein